MNSTPSDGAAGPAPDPAAHDGAGEDRAVAGIPAPRSGEHPLPRRNRTAPATPGVPGEEPVYDPDGRPYDGVDDETLHRLLSGLRDI